MNLVLVGVRGSGKSAVGKRMARRLGLDLVDLDHEVEKTAGVSIPELFAHRGAAEFRRLEHEALLRQRRAAGTVISTGGGVVLRADNRAHLRTLGAVVWLQVAPETAVRRMAASHPRPALTEQTPLVEARAVARERAPLYREVCMHTLQTDELDLDEVCDELEQFWHSL